MAKNNNYEYFAEPTFGQKVVRGIKQIPSVIYNAPGNLASGIVAFLFGSNAKTKNERARVARNEGRGLTAFETIRNAGLLGLVLGLTIWFANSLSTFVSNHKTAITRGFWVALASAALVALTLGIMAVAWPAGLALITGFTVYGFSIAALAGASLVAQVGVAAGIAAGLAAVGSAVVATVVNAAIALRNWAGEKLASRDQRFDYNPTGSAPARGGVTAFSLLSVNEHVHDEHSETGFSADVPPFSGDGKAFFDATDVSASSNVATAAAASIADKSDVISSSVP